MGPTSFVFMLVYMVAVVLVAVYLIVLATKLVGAQQRTAQALELIASRLPDSRNS